MVYEPLKFFFTIGGLLFLGGLILGMRFLYYYVTGPGGQGHVQSLILAAVLLLAGFQLGLLGLLADLIGNNRKLIEEVLYRVRKSALEQEPDKHSSDGASGRASAGPTN